jgi:hypothetical protein
MTIGGKSIRGEWISLNGSTGEFMKVKLKQKMLN